MTVTYVRVVTTHNFDTLQLLSSISYICHARPFVQISATSVRKIWRPGATLLVNAASGALGALGTHRHPLWILSTLGHVLRIFGTHIYVL